MNVGTQSTQGLLAGNKKCEVKPPLGVNMGTLMAETFKKMETAHTKDDEWGNYTCSA